MHNDEPALLDSLERGSLIEEVGEAVARCTPPQVFGVHGDWGLGKTSFLHQVQWYLTGDCPQQPESTTDDMKKRANKANGDPSTQRCGVHRGAIQAVWFDAWRYQNEAAPVVALLHEMRGQLAWTSRAVRSLSRSTEVAARGALLSMEELTKKIGFQYSKFSQASREWEGENLAASLPSHTLRAHLREAVGQLLPKKKVAGVSPRLVVFIDDVDRCEPEAAYRLLEGLKIYLTLDNCVFVLGMNQKAIEEAIAQRMKTGADGNNGNPMMRAAAYMEKLCQNVWRLPAVREPEQVLCELLEQTIEDEAARGYIRRGLSIPAAGEGAPPSTYQCVPPNPRRLKGLANLIGRLSSRLPGREARLDDDEMVLEARLLVIVAYVYQFHHDLYIRWEANLDLYNVIRDWCRSDNDLPFGNSLKLPLLALSDASSTGSQPSARFGTTYPDPAQSGVFWIQPLILHLGIEMPPQRFGRYLHGVSA